MSLRKCTAWVLTLAVLLAAGLPASAERAGTSGTVLVPAGTSVYFELRERIVSKKKRFPAGTVVQGKVWRDVVVDGEVVIPEGSLVRGAITEVSSHKPAGVPGSLRIAAQSLTLDGGQTVALTDGYAARATSAVGSTIALALLVAWPLIFLTGPNVILEDGAVLEAFTDEDFEVARTAQAIGEDPESVESGLSVLVRSAEIDSRKPIKRIPMDVKVCGDTPERLAIDEVNGQSLRKPLRLKVVDQAAASNGCRKLDAMTPKRLRKRFRRGINYFDVMYDADGRRVATEVLLAREL